MVYLYYATLILALAGLGVAIWSIRDTNRNREMENGEEEAD